MKVLDYYLKITVASILDVLLLKKNAYLGPGVVAQHLSS